MRIDNGGAHISVNIGRAGQLRQRQNRTGISERQKTVEPRAEPAHALHRTGGGAGLPAMQLQFECAQGLKLKFFRQPAHLPDNISKARARPDIGPKPRLKPNRCILQCPKLADLNNVRSGPRHGGDCPDRAVHLPRCGARRELRVSGNWFLRRHTKLRTRRFGNNT